MTGHAGSAQGWATRRWLITGTSSGFGRAMVEAVASAGGTVFAGARDPASIADLVQSGGDHVRPVRLDVADRASIAAAVAIVEAETGVDVVVNNAGYGFTGGIEETDEDQIRSVMETNFFGAAALTRACLPMLRARGSGYIVNISSLAAIVGTAASGWYCASKSALEGMSEALAQEVAEFGIKTMIVEPGAFATDFAVRSRQHARAPLDIYKVVNAARAHLNERVWQGAPLPADGIRAMIAAMDAPEPPLRLLLGPHAAGMVQAIFRQRSEEAERWRAFSSLQV